MTDDIRTVVIFYDGFEAQAIDRPFGRARSWTRGRLRAAYRTVRRKQLYTGYYTAFLNLVQSLRSLGIEVRVNDFEYARTHPEMPIGISGYPSVFEKVQLENPSVFGPGFVPDPKDLASVIEDCNLKIVTLPSEWPCKIWRPAFGDMIQPMFAPVDISAWPDLSRAEKSVDVIIYDKIRWDREARTADLLVPLKEHLDKRGLTYTVLRYGDHHLSQFKEALRSSRAMIFVCEHETQGIAYQEALASGIPVLAWDEGKLRDPRQSALAPEDLVVSSVPYFDARCGMTFRIETMADMVDRFWQSRDDYSPRDYVAEALSPAVGAKRYLDLLTLARRGA